MGGFPSREHAHPSPIRILSLTGSTRVREAINRAMAGAGFRVEHAPDAAEALRRIEASAPELVIVSMPLADADALEICRLIRSGAGGRRTAILLVAPRDFDARSQAAALDSGADACVTGTNGDLLAATVRALLRAHPEGRQLEAVLEATTDSVVILDEEWRFRYLNQRARDSVGGGRDLIGQVVWDAFPDPADTFKRHALEAAQTGSIRHFESYYAPLGMWFETRIRPLGRQLVVLFRDISDRKTAEIEREKLIRSLRESEERFRALVDQASDAFFVYNEEGQFVDVNQRACQNLGYTRAELLDMSVFDVETEYDQVRALREWRSVRPGEAHTLVGRHKRKDGSVFDVEIRLSVCLVGGERLYLGLVRDISERRRMEQALRASEERFRTLADNIAPLAWMADEAGSIIWYNRRWYDYTGTTFEEVQGWGWQTAVHPEHSGRVVARMRRSFETGEPWEDVFPLRGRDGGYRWYLARALPIRDGGGRVVRWFGTGTDITERREMEEQLRRALADASSNRSQLEAVFGAMREGVIVFDRNSKVVLVNEALARVAGYTDASAVPRDMRDFGHFTLSELDGTPLPVPAWPGSRLLRGESFEDVELRVRRLNNGAEWIVSFSGRPVRDAAGSQILAVMVLRDITARKRAEEQVIQAQKLESIGLLAGGIAHDFNNLLGSIMGYASLLEDDVPRQSVDKVHAILQSSQRAADLTRQLLAYAGKGSFVVQSVNLTQAVHEILQVVEASIPRKVRLQEELASGLPAVEADPGQLQQIVMNLALNAAEAIPQNSPGTVTVSTRLEEVQRGSAPMDDLSHTPIAPGSYVCLEVRDTGTGMDEATRARIFDPFFTTKFTGRGLGLAAVGGIVRAHRGAIQIASSPGQGTTFRILFPAAGRTKEHAPAAPSGAATVLVVDDEPMIRGFAEATLERGGYRVLTAADGRQALAIADAYGEEIDVVLLDLAMPDLAGDAVAEALAQKHPHIAIVVMSGYAETKAAPILAGTPVAGFLQKPVSAAEVLEHIADVLRSRRAGHR